MAASGTLNPRSLLFTLYGDYVHPLGQEEAHVGSLVRVAAEFGVTQNALRSAVSRMTSEGWLSARRAGGRPRYRLTQRALALIDEGTARIYGRHREGWNAQWLLVSYSLPERRRGQRDRLRQGLSFLGFGALGNGIFVSPHDLRVEVRDLILRCGVERDVTMHYGALEWPREPGALIERAWDLSEVERRYRDFVREIRGQLADESRLDDREAFRRRFLLTHAFRRFPFIDPDLPDELLPAGWIGLEAREVFFKLNSALRERAERHWLLIAENDTIVDNGATT
jgi:phenylacetic acid degradation operon negative regulatory protein